MSLWGRLLGRGEAETRGLGPPSLESVLGSRLTATGRAATVTMAENLSAVSACIGAVASAMASLPPLAYRLTDGGRVELQGHWVTRLLRAPRRSLTWCDLIEFVMGDVLLRGNALLVIETDGAGRPVELVPVSWDRVMVEILPNGRLVYVVSQFPAYRTPAEPPRRYLEDQVFHLKDRSDDGLTGRSRISRAPEVVAGASALQEWTASNWRNAATPAGAIEVEGALSQASYDRLRVQFDRDYTGTHNARKTLILDNKAQWKALSVSPEDAEVLSSRRFGIEELARLYGVPPPIIGDLSHGTFTNSETLIRFFAQSTLATWCTKFEAEFARSVLGPGNPDLQIALDLSGLLRGDPAQRWATYAIARQHDILSTDEIREIEGFNPRPAATP